MAMVKLISLNIEMNRHLDRVFPFLEKEKPDIVCLQEVSEYDFSRLQKTLGMEGRYEPMLELITLRPERTLGKGTIGIALFSRFSTHFSASYYAGDLTMVPHERDDNQGARGVLITATFKVEGQPFTVGTTHFTWTPDGEASDAQREDITNLFHALKTFPSIVFCGDFNAPRGREIWGKIAARYKDNIPLEYVSSIDPAWHRANDLRLLVDGLFSTPDYAISEVRLVEGVSDHKAIVGFIEHKQR